jgi:hypothetical protein
MPKKVHYIKSDHRKYFPDAETCSTACGKVGFLKSETMAIMLGKVTCKRCYNAVVAASKRYQRKHKR